MWQVISVATVSLCGCIQAWVAYFYGKEHLVVMEKVLLETECVNNGRAQIPFYGCCIYIALFVVLIKRATWLGKLVYIKGCNATV